MWKISTFSPIPRKINLENIKSICYNPRKSSFHTMCHFLCQAVKIQILSFFFFQSLPLEPYASPSTKPLKLTKHQHQKNSKIGEDKKTTKSENPCSRRFFGFTNFLDCKVFAGKKFVAARYGGNKNGVAPLCILNQFSFHFFVFFWPRFLRCWYFWPRISTNLLSIHESALHGRSHDWTIALCNEHWKLLFRARDLNIIFTQNLGQDLIELIYHLIKGNPKFPTEELGANPAKVKSVSKQFPPSVTPIEGKRRKATNSR